MDRINSRVNISKFIFEDSSGEISSKPNEISEGIKGNSKNIYALECREKFSIVNGKKEITVIFSRKEISKEFFKNNDYIEYFIKQQKSTGKYLKEFLDRIVYEKHHENQNQEKMNELSNFLYSHVENKISHLGKMKKNDVKKIEVLNHENAKINEILYLNEQEINSMKNAKKQHAETFKADGERDSDIEKITKKLDDVIKKIKDSEMPLEVRMKEIEKEKEKIFFPYQYDFKYADATNFINKIILNKGGEYIDVVHPFKDIQVTKATNNNDGVSEDQKTAASNNGNENDANSNLILEKQTNTTSSPRTTTRPKPKPLPNPNKISKLSSNNAPKQGVVSNDKNQPGYSPVSSSEINKIIAQSQMNDSSVTGSATSSASDIQEN